MSDTMLPVLSEKVEKLLILPSTTIKESLKRMDDGSYRILFVVSEQRVLLGTITDGDIRRWVLQDGNLQASVSKIHNKNPHILRADYKLEDAQEMMTSSNIEVLPVLDANRRIVDVKFWADVFSKDRLQPQRELQVPVVIMAGGRGSRLEPFTHIFPKPLIPFGSKPMMELIVEKFSSYGCQEFYLSVNYKAKMIQAYFDGEEANYSVHLIHENEPSGTAGSLKEISEKIPDKHFFVSNCYILIDADYGNVYDFHIESKNDITIIGAMQHVTIPYGVLKIKPIDNLQQEEGLLAHIEEKPEYDLIANTGFYVVNREVAKDIPKGQPFDFPDLINAVMKRGGKVRVYPISQKSWVDLGQWEEYRHALKIFGDPS